MSDHDSDPSRPSTHPSPADDDPPSLVEYLVSILMGCLLLVIGVSMWGWGLRLLLAGARSPAGWPPGIFTLLLPVVLTSLVVGFGSWRLLLMSLPKGIAGVSLGKLMLGIYGVAALAGAFL